MTSLGRFSVRWIRWWRCLGGAEASDAIHLVERVLRDLIREVLGDSWQNHRSVDMARLQEARKAEGDRRRGAILPSDLLEYADFMLLGK